MNALRTFLTLLVAGSCTLVARAQMASADDYFNRAGKQYVKEDKAAALRTLDQGLRQYPGDPRLLKFAEELLKDEQQKQKQQQQQQQQEQQQKEKEQQQQQQQQEQEKQQREQEQQAEEKEQDPEQMKAQPGRIAPQDARRILDALERNEKDVQAKVRERLRPTRRVPVQKDW
ncbi:MAG TPA: hypothetical protein VKG92_03955 [Flavobacteriales bacterium]|nr:hypothetical protein [Flavobacteriales bacterium]